MAHETYEAMVVTSRCSRHFWDQNKGEKKPFVWTPLYTLLEMLSRAKFSFMETTMTYFESTAFNLFESVLG